MSILSSDPRGRETVNMADSLSGSPPQTTWPKWFGGVAVPIIILYWGIKSCVTRTAFFFGQNGSSLDLIDGPAIAMGVAVISAGIFLHFHYFWGTLRKLYVLSYPGKLLSAMVFAGSFGFVLWSIMMG